VMIGSQEASGTWNRRRSSSSSSSSGIVGSPSINSRKIGVSTIMFTDSRSIVVVVVVVVVVEVVVVVGTNLQYGLGHCFLNAT